MLYFLLLCVLTEVVGQLSPRRPNYSEKDIERVYGMSYCAIGYRECPDGSCKLNRPLELCPGETCDQAMGFYYRRCNDGKRCYTMYDRCDGQILCDDGSDEHDCTVQDCSFPFQRKYCPLDRLCVAKDSDCPTYQDFSCPAHKPIRCKDYSGCYSSEQICDGARDCSDLTDEKFCESPTFKPPVTSDLTRSLTTLLGILGCIPIFGLFVFLHKYCEAKLMTYKPNYLPRRPNMQSRDRSFNSSDFDPALQEAIGIRPLVRPPLAMYRPSSSHSNMSIAQVHNPAPPYSSMVQSQTSSSIGAPPPYSSCAGRMMPVFTDLPPTYEEAMAAHAMVRAHRNRSDSEGSLLIRLQF